MAEPRELLRKYAEAACQLLDANKEPYNDDDVIKVASFLIDYDTACIDKIAEYEEQGRLIAHGFWTELEKMSAKGKAIETIAKTVSGWGKKMTGLKGKKFTEAMKMTPAARKKNLTLGQRAGLFVHKNPLLTAGTATGVVAGSAGAAAIT